MYRMQEKQVFEPVLPEKTVTLPEDFAFHPDYQHEWWHYFANVTDNQGNQYGVQWSYFRIASGERDAVGWRNPQLYIAQVAITSRDKVWKRQRIARGGIGQAGMNIRPFQLWLDNWQWKSPSATPFPGVLNVRTDTFALSLKNSSEGAFVLPGKGGYRTKHDLLPVASYNVQSPFIEVRGTLQFGKQSAPIEVKGQGWLSKEWGSALLARQQGWDWFVLQLNQDTSLTVSRFRHSQQVPYLFGTLSTRDGQVIHLGDDDIEMIPVQQVTLVNGRTVPVQWQISVPRYNVHVVTDVLNSEGWLPFMLPYWEGPIAFSGSHRGRGFMQLTGY